MTLCIEPGCRRERALSHRGDIVHAMCADHEREALSVFGESWHREARADCLRPSIVGGTTVTTARCAPEPGSPSPQAHPVPGAQRAAVAVTDG